MPEETPLSLLEDWRTLKLAYAASSDFVMRRAFETTKKFQSFRGRADLAPAILERFKALARGPADSVVLGAHLYALELTGAKPVLRAAIIFSLEEKRLREDPRTAQFAGKLGAAMLTPARKPSRGADLTEGQLDEVRDALRRQEN